MLLASSQLLQLLSALSEVLGEPIGLDDEDECVIEFEGAVQVILAQVPETQVLSLRSTLTPPGAPVEPQLLRNALALNYTSTPPGCSVALDLASEQLVLMALVDAERTEPGHFLSLLSEFVAVVPQLRESCAGMEVAADPPFSGRGLMA